MATSCEWKNKYRTAIFETNRRALPKEIAEAEDAIIARARELLQKTGGDVDAEREELDEVLYTLQAFRSVLGNAAG
jgi:hypothetical protein